MKRLSHAMITGLLVSTAAVATGRAAVAETSAPQRTIRVSGHATVKTAPDRARIAVSVTTRAATAREATETNARTSKDVLEKLRAAVRAPGEVSTAGYDLVPVYDYDHAGGVARAPKLAGYTSTNRFAVVTADLAALGGLIDAAIVAGANQVDSIGFFVSDEQGARRQALLEAGGKARAEAETVAQSLDVKLGHVLDASSATAFTPVPMPMHDRSVMAMEAASAPTEVVPGSLEIRGDVTVTFAIE